jgi:hypothetical protein
MSLFRSKQKRVTILAAQPDKSRYTWSRRVLSKGECAQSCLETEFMVTEAQGRW